MLNNVETVNNNLSFGKELRNHRDVAARHINGNDFHAVPSLFRIPEEMIANGYLCPILKDGDDFLGLKILCNEGKLSFLIRKLIDGKDSGRREKSSLKVNSLSFRCTVEVEIAKS